MCAGSETTLHLFLPEHTFLIIPQGVAARHPVHLQKRKKEG